MYYFGDVAYYLCDFVRYYWFFYVMVYCYSYSIAIFVDLDAIFFASVHHGCAIFGHFADILHYLLIFPKKQDGFVVTKKIKNNIKITSLGFGSG